MPAALAETIVPVSSYADMQNAITAYAGKTVTLEMQGSFLLGGAAGITIPAGTSVTITNKAGVAATLTRNEFYAHSGSRIDIQGSLTITENTAGGGSLTFESNNGYYCADNPQFAVYGVGSQLIFNSGTFTGHCSGYGMVYSADGASTVVNGGTFSRNRSMYNPFNNGTGQGGVIWAANCNLTINGGTFTGNTADLIGGVIFYEGRTRDNKLIVNGGKFTVNTAYGAFGGGAIFIDCANEAGKYSLAEFNGGVFDGNSAPRGAGGALYIQMNAEVKIANSSIWHNTATGDGGGIWNCATGGGGYYSFHGMYLAGNSAETKGDDFYSVEKQVEAEVYLTDYAYTGEKYNWTYDDGVHEAGTLAPSDYYQESSEEIALKSSLPNAEETSAKVFFRNNQGLTGGAIANNGVLRMGEVSLLATKKQTTESTDEMFNFQIKLTSKYGQPMSGSFLYSDSDSATNGRIVFDADGIGNISLRSGQQITILDLPVGTQYLIKEINFPIGWILDTPNNIQGVVSSSSQAAPVSNVSFTNKPGTNPPVPPTGDSRPLGLMLALAALSLTGLLVTLYIGRQRRKHSN